MGNFIDDEMGKRGQSNHEYEDAVVRGQIIEAKRIIREAIGKNRKSAAWYYDFDDYEFHTSRVDNVFSDCPAERFSAYLINGAYACDDNGRSGVCDYLYRIVDYSRAHMPDYPIHFDFEYVTKNIEKGLLDLGCKQVKVFIGPKTFIELERVGHWEKRFFSQMKKYVYETRESEKTVIKWIISISW